MSRTKTENTFHSYERAAERLGLSREEARRLMKVASRSNFSVHTLSNGPIKHFLLKKSNTGKRIKMVEGYVFVFCKTSTRCLTVYKLKEEVLKAQELFDKGYLIEYCKKCKHYFIYEESPQTPGFRGTEDLVCPHCGNVVRQSMEWEFYGTEQIS